MDRAGAPDYRIPAGRKIHLHGARGSLQANGNELTAGDALMCTDESAVESSAATKAEVLLFEIG